MMLHQLQFDYASKHDLSYLLKHDTHVPKEVLTKKIENQEILLVYFEDNIIGFLRFGYFWDLIPFINLIFIEEDYRNQGVGTTLVERFNKTMSDYGHQEVFTSSLSNETAQHFYRKLGFKDIGSLFYEVEGAELIFKKTI